MAAPSTVYERMVAVIDELPAIGKTDYNEQQKFHFRGHAAVLNALNPLLAKHGVFVVPNVLERATSERTTRSGSVMFEVSLHVEFSFFGAGGDSFTGSTWGEGTDMGDKATSKAMTMAFKSMLGQAFAISDEDAPDPDGDSPEDTAPRSGATKFVPVSQPVGGQKGAGAASSPAPTNTVQAKDGEFAGPVIEHTIGNGYGLAGEIDASPAGGEKYKGKQVRDLTSGQLSWIAGTWAPEGKEPWRPKNPTQQLVQRAVIAYQGDQNATILLAEPEGGGFTGDDDIPFAPTIDGLGN